MTERRAFVRRCPPTLGVGGRKTASVAPPRLEQELWRPGEVIPDLGESSEGHQAYGTTTWRGAMMMIPLEHRRAAADAMIRWTDADGISTVAARGAAWAVARIGLARALVDAHVCVPVNSARPGAPSLHEYLASAMHMQRVEVSVAFGSSRPNQKPIVRIHAPDGGTVGFAKVGWNDATKALIQHEADFLSAHRNLTGGPVVPELLHRGSWNGRSLVILSPTMGGMHMRAMRPTADLLIAIAELDDVATRSVGSSDFRELLQSKIPADMESSARREAEAAADDIHRRWSGVELRFGRWHGDLTPWNMTRRSETQIVWDWERTSSDAPVGLDLVHYEFHSALARRRGPKDRFSHALHHAKPVLRELGIDRPQLGAMAAIYALEMHLRFRMTGYGSGPAWLDGLLSVAMPGSPD